MKLRPPAATKALITLAALWVACPLDAAGERPSSKRTVDFNRDIRPILSDNCFACHGPDEQARKAGLRFDVKEEAFKPAKSGDLAIVPGHPDKSSLVARILTTNEDDVMPPVKSGKKLTPQQIEKLRTWIGEGAAWQNHWAFETPRSPNLPAVRNRRWARNEIDDFVLARLEREGMSPSPEADKATLIRRAALDVTGLPPTVEEVDAFLSDRDPKAYEALVDRLLSSPRHGEHMAKYWLDAARYADSHGYHIDSQRDIWAYRDWVVNAFNNNQPFDQFTVEQLAGDLLPNASTEQKIGSGFIRCNMSTGEGGAIEAEYSAKYAFDRVETAGTVWMGLTLVCARCHTHKYDPIQHKEYYQLYSFFNNLAEPVMDGNKPNPDPFMKLPTEQQSQRLDWLKQHLAGTRQFVKEPAPELDAAQQDWMKQRHSQWNAGWRVATPVSVKSTSSNGAELKVLADQSVLASGGNPEQDVYELVLKPDAGRLAALKLETLPHESLKGSARSDDGEFRLSEIEAELIPPGAEGKPGEPKKLSFKRALADAAKGEDGIDRAIDGNRETGWSVDAKAAAEPRTAMFLLGKAVEVPADAELRVRLRFEASTSKRAIGHFRLALAQDPDLVDRLTPPVFTKWQVIGPFKTEGLEAGFAKAYEPETAINLTNTYPGVREEIKWRENGDLADGGSHLFVNELHGVHGAYYLYRTITLPAAARVELSLRADDLFKLWVNDQIVLQRTDVNQDKGVSSRVVVDLKEGENRILAKVVNHQGAKYFSFNQRGIGPESVTPEVAAIVSATMEPAGDWADKVRDNYRRQNSVAFKEKFDNLDRWREEETSIDQEIPTTMIAKENDTMRESFLLNRGDYDKPGEKVTPGVPAILPPLPKDAPTNRLGLAKWLVDPSHPLTSRVTVNRLWQQMFGIGLVKTSEDFGVQGERPSHPELLDWLAIEFIDSGWDVRHLQTLILTSATYRQSSKAGPELWAKDPENRLLARGPRFRVDAEVVRDSALYLGGLLVEQRGGRSARPYEPPGLWEAVSFNNSQKYVPDTGDGLYRRSLYTLWKRQSPPPYMLIFDAPTREYCVARRPRTNTPLQALALLNDPQFVEASGALARRILAEGGSTVESRIAYAFRLATTRRPTKDEVRIIRQTLEQELAAFRSDKKSAEKLIEEAVKSGSGFDAGELAAWTTVANMILNLDEAVTKG